MAQPALPVTPSGIPASHLYAPLTGSLLYLAGTFLLFLLVGQVALVPNLPKLVLYIFSTLVALTVGYSLKIKHYRQIGIAPDYPLAASDARAAQPWIICSAVYFILYGVALFLEHGATGVSDILNSITHPGDAYFAKFEIYEIQQTTGTTSLPIQMLTLLSVLYTPLIPFTVIYGKRLRRSVRMAAYLGATVYASFYLYIGTLKGLGDLLVFTLASYLVLVFGLWPRDSGRRVSRPAIVAACILLTSAFLGYMAFNQSQRIAQSGTAHLFEPNPAIVSLAGDDFARGVAAVAFYPTHGYLGLSYNLETPFLWSVGRGSSRALDSYWAQYVGSESVFDSTYPARTEARTGWPALQYWATGYPWFASDLSFPGTIALMGVIGWFFARTWYEAAFGRKRLSLLLFCQFVLLIAYLPANNQIGTSRTSLIAFVCLVSLYAMSRLTLPRRT